MPISCHLFTVLAASLCATFLLGFAAVSDAQSGDVKPFGKTKDGTPVELYTIRNRTGSQVQICNYGGIVVSVKVPDRNGQFDDVVLGYDNFEGYLKASPYFGALVGRYGNRIGGAKFTLNGQEYKLAANNGPNSIHGGIKNFSFVVWSPKLVPTPNGPTLELHYLSKDGEEGYPGNLDVTAVYSFRDDNALKLEYTATTDKDTIVNLTHHSYFNLAGKGDILKHEVMMPAAKFLPVDSTLIPTGEPKSVEGTTFDFRKPTAIGARINEDDEQLKVGGGYDHCWVFEKKPGELVLMARVFDPESGRVMEVSSTEPGLQFYTGNHLNGSITGKGGWNYKARSAFCMEPQHFPDSPNRPDFPSVVLKPGQTFHNTIIYKFSVKK